MARYVEVALDPELITANIRGEMESFVRRLARQLADLRTSGVAQNQIEATLLNEFNNRQGAVSGLVAALKDETERVQQQFYGDSIQKAVLGDADPTEAQFMWNAIGSGTCPDCVARHGLIKTWAEWSALGRPGFGTTICRYNCRCTLIPVKQAQKLYKVSNPEELEKAARDPIARRAKEIRKLVRERGAEYAQSTYQQKLGQFRDLHTIAAEGKNVLAR